MERSIRTIVMGIAELREGDVQLSSAIALAQEIGSTLHLVHGFDVPTPVLYPYTDQSGIGREAMRRVQASNRDRLQWLVDRNSGSGTVVCHAVPSPGYRAVLNVAEEVHADLIVVGATRRGPVARAILGTTAQHVLRGASVPVLVLRKGGPGPMRRVLLTTDLSPLSESVHEHGLALVGALGVGAAPEYRSLLVLGYDLPIPPPLRECVLTEVAEEQLDTFLTPSRAAGWSVEGRVRTGEPARVIVNEARVWSADLLVVGTHARRGRARLLIGSVAESVLREADSNVLVIPTASIPAAASHSPSPDQRVISPLPALQVE